MAPGIHLTGLTTREAIADALYRCVQGLDVNDIQLAKSGMIDLKEFSFEINGFEMKGEDLIKGAIFDFIGPMDTTHFISNIRIDVKDDAADTASMTAYAVAQHYRKGEGYDPSTPNLMSGGIYTLDMVKDKNDGLWKIRKWGANMIWRQGDRAVTEREGFSIPQK